LEKAGFQTAANVFNRTKVDVDISCGQARTSRYSCSCSCRSSCRILDKRGISSCQADVLLETSTDQARNRNGGLSRSCRNSCQSSQGTPVESIKKCWKSALSPLKTR
jgi:hypothetical protein